VLVSILGAASTVVDEVTWGGAAAADVAGVVEVVRAVRARERVHRLPFTVVMDS